MKENSDRLTVVQYNDNKYLYDSKQRVSLAKLFAPSACYEGFLG